MGYGQMSRHTEIRPGQKFRAAEGLLWQVETMSDLSISIPHVKMVGVDDPSATKIIAKSVLLDQSRFNEMPGAA
jgi:hypothetical protein